MTLQQSTTLYPFPREFRTLTHIARGASQNNIAHIIGRNTSTYNPAQWVGVLYLINVLASLLFELGMTTGRIIAMIVLTLQLLSNLCRGIDSLNRFLASNTVQGIHSSLFLMCLIVQASINPITLFMGFTIPLAIVSLVFLMLLPIVLMINLILLFARLSIGSPFFFAPRSITINLALLTTALLAIVSESISRGFIIVKELESSRPFLLTSRTPLLFTLRLYNLLGRLVIFPTILLATFNALTLQAIRGFVYRRLIEELSSGKFDLLAFSATLIAFWDRWERNSIGFFFRLASSLCLIISTLLAIRTKFIAILLVRTEKFTRAGLWYATGRAWFQRGGIIAHLLTPLVSPLCCVLPGSQGHFSSVRLITPFLGNISTITFFPSACKAVMEALNVPALDANEDAVLQLIEVAVTSAWERVGA